ncbi:hypothetical protein PHLH6_45480 [Pseudomonas sp. Seg1]|nr:hypothetical protein PHLH6_45480 [Pseudomonas sp. Seg1]
MATFEEEPVEGASDDAETLDSPPYILTPSYGESVRNPVKVTGGGHAGRNVKIIGAYVETDLSDERQMKGDGLFELTFRNPLPPGETNFGFCNGRCIRALICIPQCGRFITPLPPSSTRNMPTRSSGAHSSSRGVVVHLFRRWCVSARIINLLVKGPLMAPADFQYRSRLQDNREL